MDTLVTIFTAVAMWGFSSIALLLHLITWPLRFIDRKARLSWKLNRWVAHIVIFLNPYWKFKVCGSVGPHPGAAVIVCNHRSTADVFLISLLPWHVRWMAKASLLQLPIVGWCLNFAGVIPVHRGDRASSSKALERCADSLRQQLPVIMFPEGTRSTTEEMRPFKSGAFRLAIEHQVPVWIMAVHGTHDAIRKHDWRVGRARACVGIDPIPIQTTGMTIEDLGELKFQARQRIEDMRGRLRDMS